MFTVAQGHLNKCKNMYHIYNTCTIPACMESSTVIYGFCIETPERSTCAVINYICQVCLL